MKNLRLFFLVIFLLTSSACIKDSLSNQYKSTSSNQFSDSPSNQWLETRLRIYSTDVNGNLVSDTTYTQQSFTTKDFLTFNSEGTYTFSLDYVFTGFGAGYPIQLFTTVSMETYSGVASGTGFVLTAPQPSLTFTDLIADTLKTESATTMINHQVIFSSNGAPTPAIFPYYRTYGDAYFTKE